ncbi:bifunctional DNA-formamidopyrimidine glycosylase/DNA-(apurinic or apyrimidinic site) lyase [Candidatus Omnitrophota bacterium]
MPELPEVQTIVNDLNDLNIPGTVISKVRVLWKKSLYNATPALIKKTLLGKSIHRITRRGKFIVFTFNDASPMLIHLRMSGRIHISPVTDLRDKHDHVCIALNNNTEIRLHDTRKFARVYIGYHTSGVLERLGIEPLSSAFTARTLHTHLHQHKRSLKPLLLDQSFIAGLGNIYVDESLWKAKLHPTLCSNKVSADAAQKLRNAIQYVLKKGIKKRGTSLGRGKSNFTSVNKQHGTNKPSLQAYHRTGLPCTRCGSPITRIIVAQRSTHICPTCQCDL